MLEPLIASYRVLRRGEWNENALKKADRDDQNRYTQVPIQLIKRMRSLLESFPTCVLQTYLAFTTSTVLSASDALGSTTTLYISLVISWLSIVSSITFFRANDKHFGRIGSLFRRNRRGGYTVMAVFNLAETGFRICAFVLFSAAFKGYVFGTILSAFLLNLLVVAATRLCVRPGVGGAPLLSELSHALTNVALLYSAESRCRARETVRRRAFFLIAAVLPPAMAALALAPPPPLRAAWFNQGFGLPGVGRLLVPFNVTMGVCAGDARRALQVATLTGRPSLLLSADGGVSELLSRPATSAAAAALVEATILQLGAAAGLGRNSTDPALPTQPSDLKFLFCFPRWVVAPLCAAYVTMVTCFLLLEFYFMRVTPERVGLEMMLDQNLPLTVLDRKLARMRNADGLLPLHVVAMRPAFPLQVVRVVLDAWPSALKSATDEGSTPLHLSLLEGGNTRLLEVIGENPSAYDRALREGARVQDKSYRLPLHLLCASPCLNDVRLMAVLAAYPQGAHIVDKDGFYAFNYLTANPVASRAARQVLMGANPDANQATNGVPFGAHTRIISALARVSAHRIATGSHSGNIKLWDVNERSPKRGITCEGARVFCLVALPGSRLASSSSDNVIRVWSTDDGDLLREICAPFPPCSLVAVSADLIASGMRKDVRLWSAASGNEAMTLSGHQSDVTCVAKLSRDRLASASERCDIRVWSLASQSTLLAFTGQQVTLCMAEISGDRLVAGTEGSVLNIWSLESQALLLTLSGHDSWVTCVAPFSANRIVSGSEDATIKVWSTDDGSLLQTLGGHSAAITALSVTEDTIISTSEDCTIRLYRLGTALVLDVGEEGQEGEGKDSFPPAPTPNPLAYGGGGGSGGGGGGGQSWSDTATAGAQSWGAGVQMSALRGYGRGGHAGPASASAYSDLSRDSSSSEQQQQRRPTAAPPPTPPTSTATRASASASAAASSLPAPAGSPRPGMPNAAPHYKPVGTGLRLNSLRSRPGGAALRAGGRGAPPRRKTALPANNSRRPPAAPHTTRFASMGGAAGGGRGHPPPRRPAVQSAVRINTRPPPGMG